MGQFFLATEVTQAGDEASEAALLKLIAELNADKSIDGILVAPLRFRLSLQTLRCHGLLCHLLPETVAIFARRSRRVPQVVAKARVTSAPKRNVADE